MLLKLLTQKILSVLPAGEAVNHHLQLVRGRYNDQYLDLRIKEIIDYLKTSSPLVFEGATVLEIGTGWDGIAAIIIYSLGAKKIITYDHVKHLRFALAHRVIKKLIHHTKQLHEISKIPEEEILRKLNEIQETSSLDELFSKANIIYRISCDIRHLGIKPHSLDIIFFKCYPRTCTRDSIEEYSRDEP